MTTDNGYYPHLQAAILSHEEHGANSPAWRDYIALLRAANKYHNFWLPIEECPKEEGKEYILFLKTKKIFSGHWQGKDQTWQIRRLWLGIYDDCLSKDITHYAEIPPLLQEWGVE